MMNATDRAEYRAPNTDRGAVRDHSGLVVFGRWERGEFVVSHAKPSRRYANEATADRAARSWMAQ